MSAEASAMRPDAWWRRVLVVLSKEIRDHARDKRSLVLALIYPLFGPLLIGILLDVSSGSLLMSETTPKIAGIMNPENAPALVRNLDSQGVALFLIRSDPESILRSGRVPVIIDLPEPADADGRVTVRVLVDLARVANAASTAAVTEAIRAYGRELSRQRLAAAGIDPAMLEPVTVEQVNVGRRANMAVFFYNLIPALTIFMIFLGAVYLSIDTTVGERERGSWEPLLTAPVRRWELLLGKAGAALAFTALSVIVNLLSFRLVLDLVLLRRPGLSPPPDAETLAAMFLVALPVMALAVMLQVSIAAITRSMKEAQIYLGLLPLVPALPSMVTAFAPIPPQDWAAAIPVAGQMMLFGRMISGDPFGLWQVALASGTTLVLVALLFLGATRLFEREKLFFPG